MPKSIRHLPEYSEIKNNLGKQLKSSHQMNGLFESDCEIIRTSRSGYLTSSIDSVAEEISIGLYKEPETWAWMTVMSSVSDLAASGSTPHGLMLSAQWSFGTLEKTKKRFYRGVYNACQAAEVPLLGGDSGYAASHVFTSNILGHSKLKPLMRTGAQAGDFLVLAQARKLGIGPALALKFLLNAEEHTLPEKLFRPAPDWKLIQKLRPLCRAAIDTSDGLTLSLHTLSQLNDLGFIVRWNKKTLHPAAVKFCRNLNIPPLMLWLGDLGDLQTLLVVPERNLKKVLAKSSNLAVLGQFTKLNQEKIDYEGQLLDFPLKEILDCPRDEKSYRHLVHQLMMKYR